MRRTPVAPPDHRSCRALRRGFTLVELLVALLLVEVGLLALTGTTVVLIRQRTAVRARAAAIRAASNRIQLLAAGPCDAASGEASEANGVREIWDVRLIPNAVRELRDSVTYGSDSARAIVLRTRLPC